MPERAGVTIAILSYGPSEVEEMRLGKPFKTIVVGDNGRAESDRAVETAVTLAQCLRAKVIFVGIIPPPSAEAQAEGIGLRALADVRKHLEERLTRTAQEALQMGIECSTEIVDGEPEHELERRAEKHAADLIIVGHREISRVRRWLEGSTSEGLVRRSHVSVLVVHGG